MAQYYLARFWWLPQALPSLQKILLPGSFLGPLSSDGEDHVGPNEGNGMSNPPTVERTEASAESNGLLRRPNSAQDTERAVDQTHKSKSHSKINTKMGLGPLVLMLKEPGMKTVWLSQLAGIQKEKQPASLVNIQRSKRPELSTVTVKLTDITVGERGEKSFTLKGLGLDLIVQSQVIQCQAYQVVTRSRPILLTITQRMAVTILIVDHQDIMVVVVAGLAPVPGQVLCQAQTQNQMW